MYILSEEHEINMVESSLQILGLALYYRAAKISPIKLHAHNGCKLWVPWTLLSVKKCLFLAKPLSIQFLKILGHCQPGI